MLRDIPRRSGPGLPAQRGALSTPRDLETLMFVSRHASSNPPFRYQQSLCHAAGRSNQHVVHISTEPNGPIERVEAQISHPSRSRGGFAHRKGNRVQSPRDPARIVGNGPQLAYCRAIISPAGLCTDSLGNSAWLCGLELACSWLAVGQGAQGAEEERVRR